MTNLTAKFIVNASNNDGIADIATSDLLAFYNEHAADPIKKFASRTKGEERAIALAVSLTTEAPAASTEVAVVEGNVAEEVVTPVAEGEPEAAIVRDADGNIVNDDDVNDDELTDEEREILLQREADAEQNGAPETKKGPARGRGSNSMGVEASWRDPAVREKRLTRHNVTVTANGVSNGYNSVAEAFRTLRLPFAAHIRFRLVLKTASTHTATFTHNGTDYVFTI